MASSASCLIDTLKRLKECVKQNKTPLWCNKNVSLEPRRIDLEFFDRKYDFDNSLCSKLLEITIIILEQKIDEIKESDFLFNVSDKKVVCLSDIVGKGILISTNNALKIQANIEKYLIELNEVWEEAMEYYEANIERQEDIREIEEQSEKFKQKL